MNTMGKETADIFTAGRTDHQEQPDSNTQRWFPHQSCLCWLQHPVPRQNSKNMHSADVWITPANKLIPQQPGCRRWVEINKWESKKVKQKDTWHSSSSISLRWELFLFPFFKMDYFFPPIQEKHNPEGHWWTCVMYMEGRHGYPQGFHRW